MVWLQQLHSLNNCQVPPKSLKGFQVEWTLFSINKQDLKSPKVAFNAFNSWDKLLVQSISSLTHLQFSWFLHNFLAKCFPICHTYLFVQLFTTLIILFEVKSSIYKCHSPAKLSTRKILKRALHAFLVYWKGGQQRHLSGNVKLS